jgi:hypothetical protein
MSVTFASSVIKAKDKSATGIPVPPDAVATLGAGKRAPVRATLNNGYSYRTTLAVMGDKSMLSLSAEHREAAGLQAGDDVEVTIELDTEPRTVDVPEDLAAALAKAGVRAKFDALSYSARKEHVRNVESAKAQETRDRRIAGIAERLVG